MLLYIPVINISHPGSGGVSCAAFLTLPEKGKPSSLTGPRREAGVGLLGPGATKCSYPGALAGEPTGFSTTSDPPLPVKAPC